jgi:EAL domain-containing protein (putative c-di-GMP-specific phosphodiesterase class I)
MFQPIVELHDREWTPMAMRALARAPEAASWVAEARRCHREIDADRAWFCAAATAAAGLEAGMALSIQVHATTLERDELFPRFMAEVCAASGIAPSRWIVGISHDRRFRDAGPLLAAVERLRRLGARIALEESGAGGTRTHRFVELRPDFYEIPPSLVRDCTCSMRTRAILDSLAQLAAGSGARVIARGVASASEVETLAASGIELLHGPYFCPAVPPPPFLAEGGGVVPDLPIETIRP